MRFGRLPPMTMMVLALRMSLLSCGHRAVAPVLATPATVVE